LHPSVERRAEEWKGVLGHELMLQLEILLDDRKLRREPFLEFERCFKDALLHG
jgi:hypothetical protein